MNEPPTAENGGQCGERATANGMPHDQAFVAVPLARIVPSAHRRGQSFALGYVVFAILVASLLGWVAWAWWDSRGLSIAIEFERPQGLRPGAALTLNGVPVGEVKDLSLAANQRALVRARLTASPQVNDMIAREGAVFWIPRFTADLTQGVRNIASMFATEVAVRPGTGPRRSHFVGLETEPPDAWLREGELPIVLRTQRNRGVAEGSAVFYRGLKIGDIVRTQLSRDSTKFEAWLRIFREYRPLVRVDSKFVDSSGLNLQVGLRGMSVSMESLQSIIGGSVQLFTPDSYGPPAEPGREFALEAEAPESYQKWAPYIEFAAYQPMYEAAGAIEVPQPAKATLTWKYERVWGAIADGEGTRHGLALPTTAGVIVPSDMVHPVQQPKDGATLQILGRTVALKDGTCSWEDRGICLLHVEGLPGWPADRARHASEPESCTVHAAEGMQRVINNEYLVDKGDVWGVTLDGAFNDAWHGAAVISAKDGALIGVLLVNDGVPTVHPLPGGAPFLAR